MKSSDIHRPSSIRQYIGAVLVVITIFVLSNIFTSNLTFSRMTQRISCCGPNCRKKEQPSHKHYDEKYFNWQTKLGKQKASTKNWSAFLNVSSTDVVADLGAGGGHILASLKVSRKIAIEINAVARESMEKNYPGQIETYMYPEDVPDNSVDVLYSTSAIEHFECPLTELREMARKVKAGGRVVVGIKNEGAAFAVAAKHDIDQHYYTWAPQQLFNLVQAAGFVVTEISPTVEEMLAHYATERSEPTYFRTEKAKFYLWLRGTKPLPS